MVVDIVEVVVGQVEPAEPAELVVGIVAEPFGFEPVVDIEPVVPFGVVPFGLQALPSRASSDLQHY